MAYTQGTQVFTQNKQPYNQPMSIWDAYRQGRFGDINSEDENVKEMARNNRNYYMLDAIANFGQKTADNIGRIAAAYGGGSYTPSDTTSLWEKRGQGLTQSGVEAEQANVKGSERNVGNIKAGQEIEQKEYQLTPARIFINSAINSDDPTIQNLYSVLAAQAAGADMGIEDYVASLVTANPEMQDLLTEIARGGANAAGLAASVLEKINDVADKVGNKLGGVKEPAPNYAGMTAEEAEAAAEEDVRQKEAEKAAKARQADEEYYSREMQKLMNGTYAIKSFTAADFIAIADRISDPTLRQNFLNAAKKKHPEKFR